MIRRKSVRSPLCSRGGRLVASIALVLVLNEMVLALERTRIRTILEPKRGRLPESLKEYFNLDGFRLDYHHTFH